MNKDISPKTLDNYIKEIIPLKISELSNNNKYSYFQRNFIDLLILVIDIFNSSRLNAKLKKQIKENVFELLDESIELTVYNQSMINLLKHFYEYGYTAALYSDGVLRNVPANQYDVGVQFIKRKHVGINNQVILPMNLTKQLNINKGDRIDVYLRNEDIVLRKVNQNENSTH